MVCGVQYERPCQYEYTKNIGMKMMMNLVCSMMLLLPAFGIGFGDFVDTASSTVSNVVNSGSNVPNIYGAAESALSSAANSIVSSAQNSLNQMQAQATSFVNSAVDTVKTTSANAVSTTQTAISSAVDDMQAKAGELERTTVGAVNAAVDRVKSEVNSIVDTLDNLSAQMCESQCTSFFNLPCFLLFRCTDKIKNFCLAIVLPVVAVIVIMFGCSTGLISFSCLCKALKCITGISCILWLVRRNKKNKEGTEDPKVAKQNIKGATRAANTAREGKVGGERQKAKGDRKRVDNPEEEDCPQTGKYMNVGDQL